MKAKQLLDTIKDLDLRRFGKNEYTKNANAWRGSGEIDYEAIYQFYKKKVIESIPEEYLEEAIIPEHYADIENGIGVSDEYENKNGIWYSDSINYNLSNTDVELFCEIQTLPFPIIIKRIYFGTYKIAPH